MTIEAIIRLEKEFYDSLIAIIIVKEMCKGRSKNYYNRIMKPYSIMKYLDNRITIEAMINNKIEMKAYFDVFLLYRLVVNGNITIDKIYKKYESLGEGDYFNTLVRDNLILVTNELKKKNKDYNEILMNFKDNKCALVILAIEIRNKIRRNNDILSEENTEYLYRIIHSDYVISEDLF